jgi:hypothetical protein
MTIKLDRDQLAAELAALNGLLESLPENDYLGRVGLEARRDEVHEKFERLGNHEEHRAKVALYFGGEPVIGSMGEQKLSAVFKIYYRESGEPQKGVSLSLRVRSGIRPHRSSILPAWFTARSVSC